MRRLRLMEATETQHPKEQQEEDEGAIKKKKSLVYRTGTDPGEWEKHKQGVWFEHIAK